MCLCQWILSLVEQLHEAWQTFWISGSWWVRSNDICTSTISPTRIAHGETGLNLSFGKWVSRRSVNFLGFVTHWAEPASFARYRTMLSSLWKRLASANAASRLVGSISWPSGTDSPCGSSFLYVKNRLLISIAGYVVYVDGRQWSNSFLLTWCSNNACIAATFSIAFAKSGSSRPVIVID